jgi:hypothetical protein
VIVAFTRKLAVSANSGHTGDQAANPIADIRDEPSARYSAKPPYQFSYTPSSVAQTILVPRRRNDWLIKSRGPHRLRIAHNFCRTPSAPALGQPKACADL